MRKLVTLFAERIIPLSSRRLYPSARLVFSAIFHNFTVLSGRETWNLIEKRLLIIPLVDRRKCAAFFRLSHRI